MSDQHVTATQSLPGLILQRYKSPVLQKPHRIEQLIYSRKTAAGEIRVARAAVVSER